MKIHIGTTLSRKPGPKYLKELSFAEFSFRKPLPKPKTLESWKPDPKTPYLSSLVTPILDDFIHHGQSPETDTHTLKEWILTSAKALQASCVVCPTGRNLTTGMRDRKKIENFFEEIKQSLPETNMVWSPGGLWEASNAAIQAKRMGVLYSGNPLDEAPFSDTSALYIRLQAIGPTKRFSEGTWYSLLEKISAHPRDQIFIAIDSELSFQQACQLKGFLSEMSISQ